jgi:hypothetical protein
LPALPDATKYQRNRDKWRNRCIASLQTTTIYVQAEKKGVLEEVADYYARLSSH